MITSKAIFLLSFTLLIFPFMGRANQHPQTLLEGFHEVQDEVVANDPSLLNSVDARSVLERIILGILGLVAVVALAVMIWGGFTYITSLGDEQRASTAKRVILYAVIGLLLIGASFFILEVVRDILLREDPA